MPLPPPPPEEARALAEQLRDGVVAALDEGRLREGISAIQDAARSLGLPTLDALGGPKGRVSQLVSQVGPILGDVAVGVREFFPAKDEIAARLRTEYAQARTVIVQFGNDGIDETPWIRGALEAARDAAEAERAAPAAEGAALARPELQIECLRLAGGHTSPVDLPDLVRSPEHVDRIRRLAQAVGRMVRGEGLPVAAADAAAAERARLKARKPQNPEASALKA